MLRSEQGRTALACGVLCLSREGLRDRVSHCSGYLGLRCVFGRMSHVCWLTQYCFDSDIQWPQSLQLFTVELLTPWKMKEVVFLTSVNRWEVACSLRCRTGLAASLRWALSLELCLFVMSVRKNFAEEPYRHPLIRFLQGDLFSFL